MTTVEFFFTFIRGTISGKNIVVNRHSAVRSILDIETVAVRTPKSATAGNSA